MQSRLSRLRLVLPACAWVCLVSVAPAFATDTINFTGTVVRDYQDAGETALSMPTSVAVSATGAVVVADGVNDRLVEFAADGKRIRDIRRVGEEALSHPLSVVFERTDLWIVDSGHHRILVRDAQGNLGKIISYAGPQAGRTADPTSVAPLPNGTMAWMADNDHHRLVQWDAAQPTASVAVGKHGTALGQFNYPFMLAADDKGHIYVSDSLNGRVQVMNGDGKFVGIIGRYGLEPGELYRPKGVAVDQQRRVWVADGVVGVIQVFETSGKFLGVLRDAAVQPIKFDAPTGITFGSDGDLYVVELKANRVRRLHIDAAPGEKTLPGRSRERVTGGAGQSPACTICHLEWMPALAARDASPMMVLPPAHADEPIVSRGWMCLSCHDGSVVDSRRRVWVEHGHQTGVTPPPDIKVPDYLPLVDGKIMCRTCHSAHAGGQRNQSLADAIFVRVENGSGELCIACHANKALGPAAGAHPIGGMPWAVPDKLVEAGAKVGPNPRELTCYVCHTPHGSERNDLLVMGTESSQLCLTCHQKLRPGLWRPDEHEHPQNPPLQNAGQKEAIAALGTKLGDNDTLICLSCHKVHHGVSQRYLLADTLQGSQLCLRCHPERSGMVNSSHDLRVSSPECRNRIGQTAQESGPCGACHTFHRFARMPDPQPRDPSGLCVTCHQEGQCASKVDLDAPSHPFQVDEERLPKDLKLQTFAPSKEGQKTLACLTCHNPHETGNAHFLAMPQAQLCSQCHQEQASDLVGAHDLTSRTDITNAKGRTPADTGNCGFCHAMHEAKGPSLWGATSEAPATPDAMCTSCHRADGIASEHPESKVHHPTGPETAEKAAKLTTDLPLYKTPGHPNEGAYVACGSCHNPHGNSQKSPSLVRDGPPSSDLCIRCHTETGTMIGGLHDIQASPTKWPALAQEEPDRCLSCHQPHSNDTQRGLWTVPPNQQYAESDAVCLGCHKVMTWAGHGTKPGSGTATQPASASLALTTDTHGLPLLPTSPGKREGDIGCKTCHDPHAAPGGTPHLLRAGKAQDPGAMCMACHADVKNIGLSLHGHEQMKEFAAGKPQTARTQMVSCGLCHAVHAEGSTQPVEGTFALLPPDVKRCVACHSEGGGATLVKVIDHFGPIQNVTEPGTPGYLPLVNDAGQMGAAGRIACVTCHAPHGREASPAMPAIDPAQITDQELRAMMPMVKPYAPPNLCTSCHGFDGMMRYLYWHNPEKRQPQ